MLSLIVHAVVLAALGQVAFRPTAANATRYTRVRLMKWDAARGPGRPPEVTLPGGRARPVALPTSAAPDPVAEEMQREAARIAGLRADFFGPMRIATLPMPVLPGLAGDVPPPPFWNVPLRGDLSPLPPPVAPQVDSGTRQVPQPPEQVDKPPEAPVVHTPDEPTVSAPVEMAEAAAGPMISMPSERMTEPAAEAPPAEGIPDPTASVVAQADPGLMPGSEGAPSAMPSAPVVTDPTAPGGGAAAPETGMPAESIPSVPDPGPEGAPAKGTEEPAPGPKEGGSPPKKVEAPLKGSMPVESAVTVEAPAPGPGAGAQESPPPVVEIPSEPKTPVAPAGSIPAGNGAGAAGSVPVEPLKPQKSIRIPAGGAHAGLTGSFRVPLGLSLPGIPASVAMAALIKEVGLRTALKVTASAAVSPEGIPADTPLVYLRDSGKVELTPEQRAALEAYVRKGGTLFVDGDTGEGIRPELEALFGGPAARVPATHALYTAHYRIPGAPGAKLFPLNAVRIDGRPAVLFSASFLGRRWQDAADPEHESAVALGVNLLVYAAAGRKQ